jgi:hypothetical protein
MANGIRRILSLMPCALRMLTEGVKENQRTACFRLAAQLRKVGLPYEYTVHGVRRQPGVPAADERAEADARWVITGDCRVL